jgi:hypothetical protein
MGRKSRSSIQLEKQMGIYEERAKRNLPFGTSRSTELAVVKANLEVMFKREQSINNEIVALQQKIDELEGKLNENNEADLLSILCCRYRYKIERTENDIITGVDVKGRTDED